MVFDFKLGHHYCALFDFLVDEFCFGSTDSDFLRESYLKVGYIAQRSLLNKSSNSSLNKIKKRMRK